MSASIQLDGLEARRWACRTPGGPWRSGWPPRARRGPSPRASAPMVMRPRSRICSVSTKPWSTSPTPSRRRGARTSSKISSAVSERAHAELPVDGPLREALQSCSKTKAVIPLLLLRGPSVEASTTNTPPTVPCVMKVLAPLSTQSSPFRVAAVVLQARGVRARAGLGEPPRPELLARGEQREVLLLLRFAAEEPRGGRSRARCARRRSAPASRRSGPPPRPPSRRPPCPARRRRTPRGAPGPSSPSSPSFFTTSIGNWPARSQSRALGLHLRARRSRERSCGGPACARGARSPWKGGPGGAIHTGTTPRFVRWGACYRSA